MIGSCFNIIRGGMNSSVALFQRLNSLRAPFLFSKVSVPFGLYVGVSTLGCLYHLYKAHVFYSLLSRHSSPSEPDLVDEWAHRMETLKGQLPKENIGRCIGRCEEQFSSLKLIKDASLRKKAACIVQEFVKFCCTQGQFVMALKCATKCLEEPSDVDQAIHEILEAYCIRPFSVFCNDATAFLNEHEKWLLQLLNNSRNQSSEKRISYLTTLDFIKEKCTEMGVASFLIETIKSITTPRQCIECSCLFVSVLETKFIESYRMEISQIKQHAENLIQDVDARVDSLYPYIKLMFMQHESLDKGEAYKTETLKLFQENFSTITDTQKVHVYVDILRIYAEKLLGDKEQEKTEIYQYLYNLIANMGDAKDKIDAYAYVLRIRKESQGLLSNLERTTFEERLIIAFQQWNSSCSFETCEKAFDAVEQSSSKQRIVCKMKELYQRMDVQQRQECGRMIVSYEERSESTGSNSSSKSDDFFHTWLSDLQQKTSNTETEHSIFDRLVAETTLNGLSVERKKEVFSVAEEYFFQSHPLRYFLQRSFGRQHDLSIHEQFIDEYYQVATKEAEHFQNTLQTQMAKAYIIRAVAFVILGEIICSNNYWTYARRRFFS